MRIAGVQFPEPLIDALKNDRMVVFAGAGVSMGEPANLPDFKGLAQSIADGTGMALGENDRIDGFLGGLRRERNTDIHRRAAERLRQGGPLPTELHKDLIRLFPSAEKLRLVTTNFDLLFEDAAKGVLGWAPNVHTAPALPVGHRFHGIVHVHGAINHPHEMVLTDEDFGRAYLTEGWALRFLLDLFRSFTVLFVGYSHDDLIMNYLSRALPVEETRRRFALVGNGDRSHWDSLGITTAQFSVHSPNDYSKLYAGVKGLAGYRRRGLLEWRREIKLLASKPPPISDEEADIIQNAVSDPEKVRFFTDSAERPEWIEWLDNRGLLNVVFDDTHVSSVATDLSRWLADKFSRENAEQLFLLIARHEMQVSVHFWDELGKSLVKASPQVLSDNILARWVSMFCSMFRQSPDCHWLVRLTKSCLDRGLFHVALLAFDAISKSQLHLERGLPRSYEPGHAQPPEIEVTLRCLEEPEEIDRLCAGLKPHLQEIVEPLLVQLSDLLAHRHEILCAWQHGEIGESDDDDTRRSAIESHEQNRQREGVDFLIDLARDSIDWLVVQNPAAARHWIEHLITASCPILRRLAVHGLAERTDLTADQRIESILDRIGLSDAAVRHEIFRLIRLAYPSASLAVRARLIREVSSFSWASDTDPRKETYEAQYRLNWLSWVRDSDPNCTLVREEYVKVQKAHPELAPSAHPDLHYWIGKPVFLNPRSPWSISELLQNPPADQLERLLHYEPKHPFGPNRTGLLNSITESARRNTSWGISLAEALESAESWKSDIWTALFDAWKISNLDIDVRSRVLSFLEIRDLQKENLESLTGALFDLVRKWTASEHYELLDRISGLSSTLWNNLAEEPTPRSSIDWLKKSMNRPSGLLTMVWIECLVGWEKKTNPSSSDRANKYKETLSVILQSRGLSGVLGRSIIASQFPSILSVNEEWAKEEVLPMFSADESDPDFLGSMGWFSLLGILQLCGH